MAKKTIVFVCYGNMCRSPMAEGILSSILDGSDLDVLSAGIGASGGKADPYAIQVMKERGIDISNHRRKPFERWMAKKASYIFALDKYVYNVLKSELKLSSNLYTLKGFALGTDEPLDIFDPYGGGIDDFRACADEIAELIDQAIDRGLLR
ncbi:MAG: protein tyrosine phosphatase [Candidatus Syntrophoarchaeum caldarius]|uniref:Protein tyrosine phosphatase n=1 Tax=Candidatus Syntropharchaeum caldarium TaxID=1838285 RepID=A0A1F2PAB7_9EURY|nr:MAG: protein tyrosine phosphatase [Candidatus Syntrophoarchaeum caldarius]